MVRSSYKNRKRNMTQSFKKRAGRTRNVDFIEDKMVGGAKEAELALFNKLAERFGKHIQWPIIKLTLTSASECDASSKDCIAQNVKTLGNMKKTLESIIENVYTNKGINVPEFYTKPEPDQTKYIEEAVKFILNTPIVGKPIDGSPFTLYVQTENGIQGYTTALVEKVEQSAAGGAEKEVESSKSDAAGGSDKKVVPDILATDEHVNEVKGVWKPTDKIYPRHLIASGQGLNESGETSD